MCTYIYIYKHIYICTHILKQIGEFIPDWSCMEEFCYELIPKLRSEICQQEAHKGLSSLR